MFEAAISFILRSGPARERDPSSDGRRPSERAPREAETRVPSGSAANRRNNTDGERVGIGQSGRAARPGMEVGGRGIGEDVGKDGREHMRDRALRLSGSVSNVPSQGTSPIISHSTAVAPSNGRRERLHGRQSSPVRGRGTSTSARLDIGIEGGSLQDLLRDNHFRRRLSGSPSKQPLSTRVSTTFSISHSPSFSSSVVTSPPSSASASSHSKEIARERKKTFRRRATVSTGAIGRHQAMMRRLSAEKISKASSTTTTDTTCSANAPTPTITSRNTATRISATTPATVTINPVAENGVVKAEGEGRERKGEAAIGEKGKAGHQGDAPLSSVISTSQSPSASQTMAGDQMRKARSPSIHWEVRPLRRSRSRRHTMSHIRRPVTAAAAERMAVAMVPAEIDFEAGNEEEGDLFNE